MNRLFNIAASVVATSLIACSSVRKPTINTSPRAETIATRPAGPWWHDKDIIATLGLTPQQRMYLDTIARNADNDVQRLDTEAQLTGALVESSLAADPFDAEAFREVAEQYTIKQADLVMRNLQGAAETRSVLTADQWAALRKQLGSRNLQLQSPPTE